MVSWMLTLLLSKFKNRLSIKLEFPLRQNIFTDDSRRRSKFYKFLDILQTLMTNKMGKKEFWFVNLPENSSLLTHDKYFRK